MTDQPIKSPCVGVCTINEATGFCLGCYRTSDEIREWWTMSAEEREQVLTMLEQRKLETVNFD